MIAVTVLAQIALIAQQTTVLRLSEHTLWSVANNIKLPEYPTSGKLSDHAGVVVAQIRIRPPGVVGDINILQAPSKDVAASVKSALRSWHFDKLYSAGDNTKFVGKVTFYFLVNHRVGTVVGPESTFSIVKSRIE